MTARGLVIAAPRSGAGKTTVTLAILAALRRRGVAVRAAKAGPDYIDPAFHAAATGAPCVNLDTWAMAPAQLRAVAATAARDAALLVVETAMGLFDGPAGADGKGTGADLAAALGLPVLLVLDVSGQSQTGAAVARGLAAHDPRLRVAGVVLNRVGSARHRDGIAEALAAVPMASLGALFRDASIALPERHLGLVQASEQEHTDALFDRLADLAEQNFELDAIQALAAALPDAPPDCVLLRPPGQRIALARDVAFGFAYPHLLHGWREAGAEIVPFSPLADEAPPRDCDAAWLPGGYPELHAGRLAAATRFRDGMRAFARTRPVHGECGGYMVLGAGLTDADGARHAMLGLLDHETSFARRRLHLGYRRATLLADAKRGRAGAVLRGHEFHYATLADPGSDAPFATLTDAAGAALGPAGGRRGHVSGSFFHVIAEEPS
jgi:cobyrinic acid a,c-diamide synthase